MKKRRVERKDKNKIGDKSILDRWNGIPSRVKRDISKKIEFKGEKEI